MSIDVDSLPRDPDLLIRLVLELQAKNADLAERIAAFERLVFGTRSERVVVADPGQDELDLGDHVAGAVDDNAVPERTVALSCLRKPAKRNVGALPTHLPRVERIIEPETKKCSCCEGSLHRIGEDIAETLDVIPAVMRVIRTIRPKYACRTCETGITQAPAAERMVNGGMASTALVAHVAVAKFAWHLPLYRQAQMFAGQGVALDRATLGGWIGRAAWWLRPLYERLLGHIRSQEYIFCDETPLRRLDPGRGRTKVCQLWSQAVDHRPWRGPSPPAVGYVYAEGRRATEVEAQLSSFAGVLHVDGYSAYKTLAKSSRHGDRIRLVFCLAHARRKFETVLKLTNSEIAAEVIILIRQIYEIERRITGASAGERLAVRQAEARPLMGKLHAVATKASGEISRQSSLARAIRYMFAHWNGLTAFLEDGRLSVDTNVVERSMRPIALGRRNSLFVGSAGGGRSWAILASLINTAKLNGVDPFTWLSDVLERIVSGAVKIKELDCLLPWHWQARRQETVARAA